MSAYITLNDAEEYFSKRLWTQVWDESTSENKQKSLIMATKIIDSLNFQGDKAKEDQEFEFPRSGQDDVPIAIKEACCEIALKLLEGVDPDKEIEGLKTTVSTFGAFRKEKSPEVVPEHLANGIPSYTAWIKLIPFLRYTNRSVKLSRVD